MRYTLFHIHIPLTSSQCDGDVDVIAFAITGIAIHRLHCNDHHTDGDVVFGVAEVGDVRGGVGVVDRGVGVRVENVVDKTRLQVISVVVGFSMIDPLTRASNAMM